MASIPEYVGTALLDSNSAADIVFCSVHGAAMNEVWSYVLKSIPGFKRYSTGLATVAEQDMNLAKLVVSTHSNKIPFLVASQLADVAQNYQHQFIDELVEDRSEAQAALKGVYSADSIVKVLHEANLALMYERDGLANALIRDASAGIDLPEATNLAIAGIRTQIGANLARKVDALYAFLGQYDPGQVALLRNNLGPASEGIVHLAHPN